MSDLWDDRVKAFLRKTGEEFRRFSHDVQQDARRLVDEARDPQRQKRMKEGLAEVGSWVRKTAEDVATVMEEGVKKAEGMLAPSPLEDPAPTAPSDPPAPDAAPPPAPAKAPTPAKKSVGPAPSKKRAGKAKTGSKKTLGRKAKPGSSRHE
jgi:hypothetical protein